jgi:hypothetical protein
MKTSKIINNSKSLFLVLLLLTIVFNFYSCTDDLDKSSTNSIEADKIYTSVGAYKQSLAGAYSILIYGEFLRYYWCMQEYTTDEAVSTWNDRGDGIYHELAWSADSEAIGIVFNSSIHAISLCNDFINQSSDENISKRGFTGTEATEIQQFRAEARYLRAYLYWILMDSYGNPPFPTEITLANKSKIPQIQRADLFDYIETELKEIDPILANPRINERGRPDKAAAWALLSRMYLNGTIYTGEDRYTDAITYCDKIINAGYTLETNYAWLMLGDNHLNTNEFIFAITYDNTNNTYNTTNFLCLGPAGVPKNLTGIDQDSWQCFRFTQQIPALFPTLTPTIDKRALFHTRDQKLEVTTISKSTNGYSAYKYRNVDRTGAAIVQSRAEKNLSDIDFPVFRMAEIYMTYAEAVVRGGSGGTKATALTYVNKIRGRAYANNPNSTSGNIPESQLNLDFILDEKAREFYWETHRRTDLVRHNKLTTGSYLWAWKGGLKEGTAVDAKYNLFPIPTSGLLANPNLKQISGF